MGSEEQRRTHLPGEVPPIGDVSRRRRRQKTDRGNRPARGLYAAIAILLVCAVGMVLWVNRENLKPSNFSEWVQTQLLGIGSGGGYPVTLSSGNVQTRNFQSMNKDIFVTSDTAIEGYTGTAKQLFSRKNSFSDAVMKLAGNRVLVYNFGGTSYRLDSPLKTLVSSNMEDKIISGAVCANGRFALLTQEDGYCGKLTVFLADGRTAFTYSFSEYYPTAVTLSEEGTHAAVSAVGARNGQMVSVVYLLDFNSNAVAKPAAEFVDTTFLDIAYAGSGRILAVGDTQTVALDDTGKKVGAYSYGEGELSAWSLNNGMAVLGLSQFHNSAGSLLAAIGSDGRAVGKAAVAAGVSSVSQTGTTMAALCGGRVYAFTTAGKAVGTCAAGSNARAVALRSSSQVYVLDVSEIRLETLLK